MSVVEPRSAGRQPSWQRRYEDSLEREARQSSRDAPTLGDVVAMETTGCLPGWLGAAGLAVTGLVLFLRRRRKRL